MPCPHSYYGTPDWCSQCLRATTRYVSRSPDGILMVGDEVIGHVSEISKKRQHEEEQSMRPINRRGT